MRISKMLSRWPCHKPNVGFHKTAKRTSTPSLHNLAYRYVTCCGSPPILLRARGANQEPLRIALWKSQVPSASWITLDFLVKSRQLQDCSWSPQVWLDSPWTKLNTEWVWEGERWDRLHQVHRRISLLKRQCHSPYRLHWIKDQAGLMSFHLFFKEAVAHGHLDM